MRSKGLLGATLLSCLLYFSVEAVTLPTGVMDPGGMTFDFEKASRALFKRGTNGKNELAGNGSFETLAITNNWDGWDLDYMDFHGYAADDPIRTNALKHIHREIKNGEATVTADMGLLGACGNNKDKVRNIVIGFANHIRGLRDFKGGPYRVFFEYKETGGSGGERLSSFSLMDGKFKKDFWTLARENSSVWRECVREMTLEPGCAAHLCFRHHGTGSISIRNVRFEKVHSSEPIETMLLPCGVLDNVFAISKGQPGGLFFAWRKCEPAKYDFGKFSFRMELPKGFTFIEAARTFKENVKVKIADDGHSVVTFKLQTTDSSYISDKFNIYAGQEVMVRADGDVGTKGVATFQVFYDSKPISAVNRFMLTTIPAIRTAKAKFYMNGIHCHECWRHFPYLEQNGVGNQLLGAFMNDCGVDWVIGAVRKQTMDDWRKRGIRVFTPVCGIANGFQIEPSGNRPEADRFQGADGKRSPVLTCPCAVYEESDHFLKYVVPHKQHVITEGGNGIWSNWEPGGHMNKGCFCERCRKSFAKWVGRDESDVAKDWPTCVRKGGRFEKENGLFRTWQLAQIVKTLDKHVRAVGGEGNMGFIPGVAWIDRSSRWRKEANFDDPIHTPDYTGSLHWINYWGPYVAWKMSEGYSYDKRKPLAHFISARDVRETIDATYPPERRPKIMMMPNGQQGTWTAQPEWVKMAMDSYFFNRWEATVQYYFPCGVDARYWKAFADATSLAAKYEDVVRNGYDVSPNVTLEPISPYAANCRVVTMETPKWRNVSPLLQKSYMKDGVTAVAMFNFWEKGEVFVRLRIKGLKGSFNVISSDGTLFGCSAEKTAFDGKELEKTGVLVHLGAARTGVFEIRPVSIGLVASSVLTESVLKAHLEDIRGTLQIEADKDAQREKLNDFDPPYDVMTVL